MKLKSIKSHLKPYSIEKKRRTTIAHAFASALAPTELYAEPTIKSALEALGQSDTKNLICVYCDRPAQTWDHLTNLVKAGEFNGYGHQIGNLVPCCRECNSAKGSSPFQKFVENLRALSDEAKIDLTARLTNHQLLAKEVDSSKQGQQEIELLKNYRRIQDDVLELLKTGDKCAEEIRELRERLMEVSLLTPTPD
jgi:hypothetical protein